MSGTTRETDLHRLREDMLDADDARIMRIVRVVDALPERGDADVLIAPLRPRLAVLRPARPLTLPRLLFLPLDPLIVPPARWRPGAVGIPRSVLKPLGHAVAQALGPLGAEVQALIAGRETRDTGVAADAGEVLWPAVAAVLRQAEPPAAVLSAIGATAAEAAALLQPLAALLAHGPTLYRLIAQPDMPLEAKQAEALLGAAGKDGALALDMMMVLLLADSIDVALQLRLGEEVARRFGHPPPDRALDFLLGPYSDASTGDDGTPGSDSIRRAAILLDGMERRPGQRPPQLERLDRLRRRLDGACRARFELAAERLERMAPAVGRSVAEAGPTAGVQVNGMEAAALDLRRLEAVGRRVGGPDFSDAALHRAAERLAVMPGLTAIDRLRITEILLGADAALALFGIAEFGAEG